MLVITRGYIYIHCIPILDGFSACCMAPRTPRVLPCPKNHVRGRKPVIYLACSIMSVTFLLYIWPLDLVFRRLKRGNTDLKQGHLLQMPQKSIKMAIKGGVLYFETNPSFMLLAIECVYIYTTHIISNYISIIRHYIPATSPSKLLKQNQPTYFW